MFKKKKKYKDFYKKCCATRILIALFTSGCF